MHPTDITVKYRLLKVTSPDFGAGEIIPSTCKGKKIIPKGY
jgi:hypothetical protein